MKKRIVFASLTALGLILVCVFALSSFNKGFATGVSEDFQMDKNTLVKYLGYDETVIIPDNTTVISAAAFEGNSSVKKVVLPKSLKEIGYNAFAEMDNLERIVIPDSVEKIGTSAFANCESLSSIYIGSSVNEIGSSLFAGDDNLKVIEVSEDSKYLTCLDGVLYSADRTVVYEMIPGREKNFYVFPDTVSAISPYAFWGCKNLEHTIVSDKVSAIPAYAFSGATGLKSVTLSFNTKEIQSKAFENCVNLEQIFIPDSVYFIADSAFDGCDKLSILTSALSNAEKYATDKEINAIYSAEYDINLASTLRENYAKEVAEKKAKEEAEAEEKFFDITKDDSLGAAIIVNNEAVVLMDPTKIKLAESTSLNDTGNGYDVVLEENIEDNIIPENLFYLKSDLTEINIPENTKYIGKFAFARSGLKKVVIPENVRSIGFGAFYHCDDLNEVVIPDTVTEIEPQAFEKTAWLNDWYENGESDYLIVGDGILIAYKGNPEDYVKPENVKSVSCDIK